MQSKTRLIGHAQTPTRDNILKLTRTVGNIDVIIQSVLQFYYCTVDIFLTKFVILILHF
jgi:hypothetical protein